jgi:Glycosyl transferase family 2
MTSPHKPVVLCFGTLDDGDIIEYFLEYHLGCGIDAFVATDVGSTDETIRVLERYERTGILHLTRLQNPEIGDVERDWGSGMAPIAAKRFNAGTCIFADADEFWVFPNHDASAYFAAMPSDIVLFPRYNMLPSRDTRTSEVAHFSDFDLLVRRPLDWLYDVAEREAPEDLSRLFSGYAPEVLRAVLPKVAAPPEAIASVGIGFHDVVSTNPSQLRHYERAGYVTHYPVRSLEQWRRKAQHVARFIDRNPPETYGYASGHWVRFSALFKNGLIDEDFLRQVLSAHELAELLLDGTIERDDNVARWLRAIPR